MAGSKFHTQRFQPLWSVCQQQQSTEDRVLLVRINVILKTDVVSFYYSSKIKWLRLEIQIAEMRAYTGARCHTPWAAYARPVFVMYVAAITVTDL